MAARLGTLTLDLIAKIGQFVEPVEKAGKTMERESRRIESSANSAMTAIKGLGAAALAGLTVKTVIDAADGYTQMAAQIRNATNSVQEYNTVQKHLLETANTTYRSLQEAQQVYLDVGGALKAYGYSTEQALRITDSLSFSFTHNATQADKAASATNAFMKSIYSGKVSGDAWVSILSAIPSIVDDLSKSLGKSKEEILTMGNAGQITSKQLNHALDTNREKSEGLANAMSNSLADGMTKVKNEFTALVGELNITYGVTNKMAGALGALGEASRVVGNNLDVVAVGAGALGVVLVARMTPAIAASGIAFTQSTVQAVAYQLALARMAAQAAGTTTSLVVLRGAAVALGAFMLSPVGLAVAAAGVAAGYVLIRNSTAAANAEVQKNAEYANLATAELLKLEGAQRRAAHEGLEKAFAEQNKELKDLNFTFNGAVIAIQNYATKNQVGYQSLSKIRDISNQVRQGIISQEEAIKQINKLDFVTGNQINSLNEANRRYEEQRASTQKTATALGVYGQKAELAGNAASNAAGKVDKNSDALDSNAASALNAANAQTQYQKSLASRAYYAEYKRTLISQYGFTESLATEYAKLQEEAGGAGARISKEAKQQAKETIKQESALKSLLESQRQLSRTSSAPKRASSNPEAKKALREAERESKELADLRVALKYEFSDREQRLEVDHQAKLLEIRKAYAHDPAAMSEYIAAQNNRFNASKSLYDAQLGQELYSFKLNETEKLNVQYAIEKMRIELSKEYSDEEKRSRLKAINEQHQYAVKMQQIEEQKKLLEIQRTWLSAADYASQYYALVRQEILQTAEYSPEMKNALIKQSSIQEGVEANAEREGVWDDYKYMMGLDDSMYEHDLKILQKAREQMLLTEEEYQQQRVMLQTKYGAAYAADFAGMLTGLVDRSSSAYAGLYAIQKGFNLASAIMSGYTAISAAWASAPFPANLPAVAMTTMETGVLEAAIQSVTPVGMAHNGIDNIPKEGTWLLDGGERVLNPQQNKDLTSYLADKKQGGVNITINNNTKTQVNARQNEDGSVTIDIVEKWFNDSMQNPNSTVRKSLAQNTTAVARR